MAEQRLQEDKEEELFIEALLEAEKQARRHLEKVLGSRSSRVYLILKLERKEGTKVLEAAIQAEGLTTSREALESVLEESLEIAFKVFEERARLSPIDKSRDEAVRKRLR
ncbi:MAG: hypothetical protein QXN05_01345 [Acidilobaceae archaeon]